jgi:adenylate kinase family enzyme
MRISIVGLPGSGKTWLAEALAKKLGIPHVQIDRFWFESDGLNSYKGGTAEQKERVRIQVREKVLAALEAGSWVSDGFYSRLQPDIAARADTIVFLDIPLWRRLLNHARRIFISQRHPELTWRHELTFFFDIVHRQFGHKPKLLACIEQHKGKVVRLRSRQEMDRYLREIQEK